MKRTELKRTGELKRTTPLNRGTSTMSRGAGFAAPQQPLKRTVLKFKSDRQVERDVRYFALKVPYMEAHEFCERCGKPAVDCHHMAGKIGENYFRWFMAACRECHTYFHEHTDEARELGYLFTDNPRRVD